MNELGLAQSFSMFALNAQDSRYMTTVKKVALRCIAAAAVLEFYLGEGFSQSGDQLTLQRERIGGREVALYQSVALETILSRSDRVQGTLRWWMTKAASMRSSQLKKLERAMADSLKAIDLIDEIPNLLGCDMLYVTSGNTIREYRSEMQQYTRISELTRAEILEAGEVSDETIFMLWLLRESGCLRDLFSNNELEAVAVRMSELYHSQPLAKTVFDISIHRGAEIAVKNFLGAKKLVMKTQTGIGVNFIFPELERSQSIFIDTEAWFSKAGQRLIDVENRLIQGGHSYEVLHAGQVPLIKIDNIIYEAIPDAIGGRVPIHGVRLRKYPI